jgi:hypothetical protein
MKDIQYGIYAEVQNNIIQRLAFYRHDSNYKLLYDRRNYPLKKTEPRFFAYLYNKTRSLPLEKLYILLNFETPRGRIYTKNIEEEISDIG